VKKDAPKRLVCLSSERFLKLKNTQNRNSCSTKLNPNKEDHLENPQNNVKHAQDLR
jgi:hypothetical protein